MRIWLVMVGIFLFLNCGVKQESSAQRSDEDYSVHLVRDVLRTPAGAGASFTEKQADRLGDRASIALLKIFEEKELANPQNVRKFLPIIRNAFVAPQSVSIAEDRKPRVTLFLLKYLQAETNDAGLKGDIAQLIDYIKQKTTTADKK